MLARRTSKNQITLPERVADQFAETDYFEVTAKEGEIVLRPVDVHPPQGKLQEIGIDSGRADPYARAAEVVGSLRHGDGTADLSLRHDEHLDQAYR
ncbi:MAG TPA: AbrB/MazE/SpoVT family DNA-binding domain-containing protein [Thermoanaerobaculia bacterium]|nr:AbrB/MazE/SpoVT family DNA-binding domain-containing protein [Thermoanaerobaculia bacterium]